MFYPISISKNIKITINKSTQTEEILNGLFNDLVNYGMDTKRENNHLKIVDCAEFSSRTTFKDFNRGKITITKIDMFAIITFKIYLIEHLIIFFSLLALGTYGIVISGLESKLLKISLFLFLVNFVFTYLMPFMSLDSFVKRQFKMTDKQN